MEMTKGFIYTLEAIIASALVLGTALFIIPQTFAEQDPDLESIENGLRSLDNQGELGETPEEITEQIQAYVPPGYNATVRVTYSNSTYKDVNGEESFYLREGGKKLLMWPDSDSGFEATYGSTTIGISGGGYHETFLDSREGYLNFSSEADLKFQVDRYVTLGDIPERERLYSTNYLKAGEGLKEVQVMIWR